MMTRVRRAAVFVAAGENCVAARVGGDRAAGRIGHRPARMPWLRWRWRQTSRQRISQAHLKVLNSFESPGAVALVAMQSSPLQFGLIAAKSRASVSRNSEYLTFACVVAGTAQRRHRRRANRPYTDVIAGRRGGAGRGRHRFPKHAVGAGVAASSGSRCPQKSAAEFGLRKQRADSMGSPPAASNVSRTSAQASVL